jgi:hypothetical protein
MRNIIILTLISLAFPALALQDWVLLTPSPDPVAGVTVIDTRIRLKDNDNLRDYIRKDAPMPGVLPTLVHVPSGFMIIQPTEANVTNREALLAASGIALPPDPMTQKDLVQALKTLKVTATNNIEQARLWKTIAQTNKVTAHALDQAGFTGTQSNTVRKIRAALIDDADNMINGANRAIDQAQSFNDLRQMLLKYFKVNE